MQHIQNSNQICPCFPRRLDLVSFSRLEALLGIDRTILRSLASSAGALYDPFPQKKRIRPFQKKAVSSKIRKIDNPLEELKVIQQQINRRLLTTLDLPSYIFGGVAGKNVLDNARLHLHAKVLIRVDIAHFFPSITNVHIYKVWQDLLGCSPRISALLTRLTTFERRLPQGSPSSTLLANLVLLMVDGPIRSECRRLGIRYSSWVDDLAFSSDNPREILRSVVVTLHRAGFTVSRRKLEIMGPGERKILCGVLLRRFPSVPRERISGIRSGIYKLHTGEVFHSDLHRYVRSLQGSIAHVRSINPRKAIELSRRLETVMAAEDIQIQQRPTPTWVRLTE
jgi:RNA-directed DNA polymerase